MSGARLPALAILQFALAEALRADDPAAAVRALADRGDFPDAWRASLRAVPTVGVQLTERLVTNLRFDRVQAASALARERFAADPRAFARCFAAFCRRHPARDWHPVDEARAFEAFLEQS